MTVGEIIGLVGILVTGLVALVGWRRALANQERIHELEQAAEQRRYDRNRGASQLDAFDEMLMLSAELAIRPEFLASIPPDSLDPRSKLDELEDKFARLATLASKCVEIANTLDRSGQTASTVRELIVWTMTTAEFVADELELELTPEIEEKAKSVRLLRLAELRQELRDWVEEVQANDLGPS